MDGKARQGMDGMGQALQRVGPYVLIEILLPGGTLIALLLLLYRHGPAKVARDARRLTYATVRALSTAATRMGLRLQAKEVDWLGPASGRSGDGLEPLGLARD